MGGKLIVKYLQPGLKAALLSEVEGPRAQACPDRRYGQWTNVMETKAILATLCSLMTRGQSAESARPVEPPTDHARVTITVN